jgi:hypothetical protein
MRRWLVLLSLSVMPIAGCQAAVSPSGTPTVQDQRAALQPSSFAIKWRRAGWGWGRGWGGRWGGWGGWGRGAFVRPVVPIAPVVPVAPIAPLPVVSTVVYPTFAGAYGYFW